MHVGYMYERNQVHGLTSSSTIKEVLDTWYLNNLQSYADDIDGNAGFCGDRTPYKNRSGTTSGGGSGTTTTYYGGYIRLSTNKTPTFDCLDEDLYTITGSNDGNSSLTYPIGLISADEVAYVGGVYNTNNTSYYLYTGQTYWTMSPYYFSGTYGEAHVFGVKPNGDFYNWYAIYTAGVRPVINLRADVQITEGNGTSSNPYVVS